MVRQPPSSTYLIYSNNSPACSRSKIEDFASLSTEINKENPNTKVVDYPLNFANEQDTLSLIDEVLNSWGRLDVWVCSSGLLGPPSIGMTTPSDMQKCFEANTMAPFFALKYAPPAMAKKATKGSYPNAAPKDVAYGSIVVVSSVASTYGGMSWARSQHLSFTDSSTSKTAPSYSLFADSSLF